MTLSIVRYLVFLDAAVSLTAAGLLNNGWFLLNGLFLILVFGVSFIDE